MRGLFVNFIGERSWIGVFSKGWFSEIVIDLFMVVGLKFWC